MPRRSVLLLLPLLVLALVSSAGGGGPRDASAATAPPPACFGAADRDPLNPCDNPALRFVVSPMPRDAIIEPNSPCQVTERTQVLLACAFGAPAAEATATVGLIGDSHASHWRAAVDVVARAKGWHGVSITHSSCPFSRAVPDFPEPKSSGCVRWNRAVTRWLAAHPAVSTVLVSEHSGGDVRTPDGRSGWETHISGYLDAWNGLPASVRHIVVIRDTPRNTRASAGCVERAAAARQRPAFACAVPRRAAVRPDPAAVAVRRIGSPRVQLVDLTRYMCSPRLCFPVIGGALVHKDIDHLTVVFATSLGPFLGRALDRVMASWGAA